MADLPAYAFRNVPEFFGPGLKSPIVFDRQVTTVDDSEFLAIAKNDREIERLLTCRANTERIKDVCRPLALTDIIEELLELRLQAYQEQAATYEPEAGTGMNDDDEVVRPAKRKPNAPKTCIIQAPSVGTIAGIEIRIVLQPHKDPPIFVEKDAIVLENLSSCS